VQSPSAVQPPFDPVWLDQLADGCRRLRGSHPRFEDLYLERRLEIRVESGSELASVSSDGAAARWRFPSRWTMHASTGVCADAVAALVSRYADRLEVPPSAPLPRLDLDPPRGWADWAREIIARAPGKRAVIRYLARRAVVVRRDGWHHAVSPPLVRLETARHAGPALLSVWGHERLGRWIRALFEPPPSRPWSPPAGLTVPVLFTEGTAGAVLHELVAHLVEGDLVASGQSPLGGLGGAALTDAAIDLMDDPGRVDLPGAFTCDDEGVPAAAVALLRGGRLCGVLCDRETAEICGTRPGRGRRADWRYAPAPRLSNLVVPAGREDPRDMESGLTHGLVVTRLAGATIDPISGRTVLRVEQGFEVRHGRRHRSLDTFELTGGVTEILAGIDPAVGNDPTPDWRLGWCVKGGLPLPTGSEVPTVLVRRLEVL
jgi:hypothetical protein